MRNLTVHSQSIRDLANYKEKLSGLSYSNSVCCINSDNDDFYLFHKDVLFIIHANVSAEIENIRLDICTEETSLVAAEFCSISQQICCGFDSGTIAVINIERNFGYEVAAFVNEGLQCMKISPDHEILTLITKENNVMVMLLNFHIISEINLFSEDFGEKEFITVGWGKKETQFHGSEGKAVAKAVKTAIEGSKTDDGLPRICWRGDGNLFAVSFLHKNDKVRRFKVYSREGVLQYTSELVSGLEENLAWKPSGNLISSSQKLPNKHVIALFEKNGLKHREFTLPLNERGIKIKNLSWSEDSDILSTLYEVEEGRDSCIQLWTEKNYHWYSKQTIRFPKENSVLYIAWSTASKSGKKLIVLTAKEFLTYTFRWTVNHSGGKNQRDKCVVGVIDGTRVLLTGFRDNIIPPPMAQHTLDVGEEINEIVFAPGIHSEKVSINSNSFFCVLHNNKVVFYKYTNDADYMNEKTYEIKWHISSTHQKFVPYAMNHFLWFKENIILCSLSSSMNNCLCVMYINDNELTLSETYFVDGSIEHIAHSPDLRMVYIVTDNLILKYTEMNGVEPTDSALPESCCQVEIINIREKHVFISRTSRHRLYIDNTEVANNVTSFFVHSRFLLITTLQHTLICFPLNENGLDQLMTRDLTIKPWGAGHGLVSINELNIRRIERGSNLVVAVADDAKTILQMPRGNLECIQPRALSLFTIASYIDSVNYRKAFDTMRKQRINLNLIFDHDPAAFLKNATKFVDDVNNPQWLSLFLSELKNEDVTQTTYASCYPNREEFKNVVQKVEIVCTFLREIMESRDDAERWIQPILISLVKNREGTGLEDALRKIKEIKSKEGNRCTSAEEALKYLLYMVDVNYLFDIALGMYDFDLTMFVAQKSQKDPKEYVPFLNGFKKLEENYMKYSIDAYLKRYNSALEHIAKLADKFNECLYFVKKHNLYTKALKLFPMGSEEYKEIAKVYGLFLLSKAKYQEAGIMLAKSEHFTEASHAYTLAGSWQEAIVMTKLSNLSTTKLRDVYEDLASRLKNDKRYKEAALILSKYLDNSEDSVATLCEGKIWHDAWREAHYIQREDLIETEVKPGVINHAEYLLQQVKRNRDDFERYKSRLAFVRSDSYIKEMERKSQFIGDYDITTEKGMNDLLSDTTSVMGSAITRNSQMSRTTGRSYRSSKNRRKQERKLLSLKEGSIFEDLALIGALHQLITNTYNQTDEIYNVAQMLLLFNIDAFAESVSETFNALLRDIEDGKSEIWVKKSENSKEEEQSFKSKQFLCGDIPPGLVDVCILSPPENKSSNRKLNLFSPVL